MSINSLSSSAPRYDNYLRGNNDDKIFIGVAVKPGETLKPDEILRRAVMSALGTDDAAPADEFIKQTRLAAQDVPLINKGGVTLYEYPVDAKFYADIEQFKLNGKVDPPVSNAPAEPFSSNGGADKPKPNGINQQVAVKTGINPATERRRFQLNKIVDTQPNMVEQIITGGGRTEPKKDKTITVAEQKRNAERERAVWEYTKQGLDGGRMTIPLSKLDLLAIRAAAADGDARLELLTKALQKLGYSDQAITSTLKNQNLNSDASSGVNLPGATKDEKADINNWLDNTIKVWQERESYKSPLQNVPPENSTMTLDAGLRKAVYVEDLRLKGGEDAVKKYEFGLDLQKQYGDLDKKYQERLDKAGSLLQKAAIGMERNIALKDLIDDAYANSGLDFRSTQTASQREANGHADTIEKIIRYGIEMNPTTMFLPESIKNRIVNAGIGITNGVTYLESAREGINDFITDKAIDALSYGAKQIGIDTKDFDKGLTEMRQARAEKYSALANLQTKYLGQMDTALAEKINRGLPLGAGDIPSLERSIGQMLPQAGVQIGIAAATGGTSIPLQIAVTALVNGGIAFGGTYAQTNDSGLATEEALWTAAQTATLPISNALPGLGDIAFDMATGYITGKMRGQNDVQILDGMLAQGLLGAGFRAGAKFADLTKTQQQTALQRFNKIAEISNKAIDANYNFAKKTLDHVKKGLTIDEAKVSAARQTISEFSVRQRKAPNLYIGGLEPALIKSYGILAADKIQKGVTRFADFSTQMIREAGNKIKPHLEKMYRAEMLNSGFKVDEAGIARTKLTNRTDAQLKADLDPTIRRGETIKQAETRIDKASAEINLRGVLSIYDLLGIKSPKINIAENDKLYGKTFNAHTLERHGADTPLKRTDAPAGTATLEGRIYGDPPWNKAENFSYKWLDDSTMNNTIDEYISKNWDSIRWELANNPRYEVSFDAGKAIGEGYFNSGQAGTGSRNAVYHKTSLVKIRFDLDQTEPQKIVIKTAYPAGKGQ